MYAYIISSICVVVTMLLGAYFTSNSAKSEWYKCIKPRSLTPPNIIFPIVWTILYFTLFLGLARAINKKYILIQILFVFTLILNVAWCYYYFKKRDLKLAFIIILILIGLAIGIISISIYKKDYHLAKLITPYLLWIIYASVLNYFSISKISVCKNLFF
jgi:tryptophan-rich sensory protein